jgi:hypothetical protein
VRRVGARAGGLHRAGVAAIVVTVAVLGAVALAVFVIIIAVAVRAFVERAHHEGLVAGTCSCVGVPFGVPWSLSH